jgi:hypothetical protein
MLFIICFFLPHFAFTLKQEWSAPRWDPGGEAMGGPELNQQRHAGGIHRWVIEKRIALVEMRSISKVWINYWVLLFCSNYIQYYKFRCQQLLARNPKTPKKKCDTSSLYA